ncbi:hypothetical protein BKA63DRAFT_490792 [Paraphoma chrysanthemicola]|nr:hypothetical protein BKA63DRAFT_490792 [Paraphoma chrysanthemicola]
MPPNLRSEPTQNDDSRQQAATSIPTAPTGWSECSPSKAVATIRSYGAPVAGWGTCWPDHVTSTTGSVGAICCPISHKFRKLQAEAECFGWIVCALTRWWAQQFPRTAPVTSELREPERDHRLSFPIVAEMTGLFGAFPRYVRGKSVGAAMAALQSYSASKGLTWGEFKLHGLWHTLNNLFIESIQAALGSQTSDDRKQKPQIHTTLGARLQNTAVPFEA